MLKPLVTQVWPQFTADEQFTASFSNVFVERVELFRSARKVIICLRSTEPLDSALCGRLLASLEQIFAGYELTMRNYFNYNAITPEAVKAMIEELKQQGMPVNGFLDKTQPVAFAQDGLVVRVNAGLPILESVELPRHLAELIQERTGALPIVRMELVGKQMDADELDRRVAEKVPAVQFKAKEEVAPFTIEGLELTSKPAKVFYGKSFKPADLRPLNDLGDGGKVTVWGDVFFTEVKGNRRKIYFTSITDYNGSINLKVLGDENEDMSKWEGLKSGTTLIVRGNYTYDKYEHDYVLLPYDVLQVERMPRHDDAPEGQKRVELHLHTKSSSMDGFCDSGKIVRLAHRMGHRAIAITDHGVCQGYPEAMLATDEIHQDDPNFKLIYGCEAYFVDDMIPAVYGTKTMPITGSFVVFDTETTGLDSNVEALTEIGAVYVENGKINPDKSFCTFVNPGKPIPQKVVELTGINDSMVADAPTPAEAIRQFKEFCGDNILVAHNANSFDMLFIRKAGDKAGVDFSNTYIDTLPMAQALFPGLHNYKLDTINKHLEIQPFNHHRAVDDAMALARIFEVMLSDLKEKDMTTVEAINTGLGGNKEVLKKKYYHLIILVQNQTGLKNLYRIVSAAHTKYFFKKPRVPRSLLNQYREGLLLSPACEAGELYRAVVAGKAHDELLRIARYYDYLEVQPLGNNEFMVRNGQVDSIEAIKNFNRTIIQLGEELHIPVVATGDVHFQEPEDRIYRAVLQAGNGFKDADNQAPLFYRTTPDMLEQFSYLPQEKAFEICVTNPNKIAATIDNNLRAIPKGTYPPSIEGAEDQLRSGTWQHARRDYGNPLPDVLQKRLKKELDSICGHGYAVLYVIAVKLVAFSNAGGYQVGSRGSVGSSAVAHFSGISEVNSMPPHYLCTKCKHSEWIDDGVTMDGFDLPDKKCPVCGEPMIMDGHDIPFETFLGFYGDKEPDIDLNFSGMYQSNVHRYTEELFGKENVFKAGTVSGLQDKTAYGYVKKYLEERGKTVNRAEENRLCLGCTGVKRTTGQHPGGLVVVPDDMDVEDFTAVQHPADAEDADTITTHFEYHCMEDNLLKLDMLGHDDPTMIRMLEDLTGVNARQIPLDDPDTMSIFVSSKVLGFENDELLGPTGAVAIPEFNTRFTRGMLMDTLPKDFNTLVRLSGFSHGTDVWLGNARELIVSGTASVLETVGCRDDIMLYLISMGLDPKMSFKIMEAVRKGKVKKGGFQEGWVEAMQEHNVPQWYIDSLAKIGYLFPKAHAVAYVMMAFRIAWFKVHRPLAFYATFFTVRAKAFDAEYCCAGIDAVKQKIREIENNKDATAVEKNLMVTLEVCYEFYLRGFHFDTISIYDSDATAFKITENGLLPPFISVRGLGESAALDTVEKRKGKRFISVEEFSTCCNKLSKTHIEQLKALGSFAGMADTSQITLF